jgi:hypothetical protein
MNTIDRSAQTVGFFKKNVLPYDGPVKPCSA